MEPEEKIRILKKRKFRLSLPLDEIVELYETGITPGEIASKFGVAYDTIWRRLKFIGIPLRSASEAAKLGFKQGKRVRKRGEESPTWKGGRVNSGTGYIWLKLPRHPRANKNGYVAEHIVVWEQVHNKPLPDGWQIHHLNGIGTDNRPENLVAMPDKKHIRLIPIYRQRIRELEAKIKLLERALDSQQMIWWTEN